MIVDDCEPIANCPFLLPARYKTELNKSSNFQFRFNSVRFDSYFEKEDVFLNQLWGWFRSLCNAIPQQCKHCKAVCIKRGRTILRTGDKVALYRKILTRYLLVPVS